MLPEELIPINPVNFFQISLECYQRKGAGFPYLTVKNRERYLLPDLSSLCHEDSFADVALAWSQEGIEVFVQVREPFQQSSYPRVDQGDSVEIFLDTRDV